MISNMIVKGAEARDQVYPVDVQPLSNENRKVISALAIGIIAFLGGVFLVAMAKGFVGMDLNFAATICSACFGPIFLALSIVSIVAAVYFCFRPAPSPDAEESEPNDIEDLLALLRTLNSDGDGINAYSPPVTPSIFTPSKAGVRSDVRTFHATSMRKADSVPLLPSGSAPSSAPRSFPFDDYASISPPADSHDSASMRIADSVPVLPSGGVYTPVPVSLPAHAIASFPESAVNAAVEVAPIPLITPAYLESIRSKMVEPIFKSLHDFLREMIRCEHFVTNDNRGSKLQDRLDSLDRAMVKLKDPGVPKDPKVKPKEKFKCYDLEHIAKDVKAFRTQKEFETYFLKLFREEIGKGIISRLREVFDKSKLDDYTGGIVKVCKGVSLIANEADIELPPQAHFLGYWCPLPVESQKEKIFEGFNAYYKEHMKEFYYAFFYVGYYGFLTKDDFQGVLKKSLPDDSDWNSILLAIKRFRTAGAYSFGVQEIFTALANRLRKARKENPLPNPQRSVFPALQFSHPPTIALPPVPVVVPIVLPAAPAQALVDSASASVAVSTAAASAPAAPVDTPQKAAEAAPLPPPQLKADEPAPPLKADMPDSHPVAALADNERINLPPRIDVRTPAPSDRAQQVVTPLAASAEDAPTPVAANDEDSEAVAGDVSSEVEASVVDAPPLPHTPVEAIRGEVPPLHAAAQVAAPQPLPAPALVAAQPASGWLSYIPTLHGVTNFFFGIDDEADSDISPGL